jgi:TonB family protein
VHNKIVGEQKANVKPHPEADMKSILLAAIALFVAGTCSAQISLFPRHVTVPQYPVIARTAHISGQVVLLVTIGADGTVTDTTLVSGPPLLGSAAITNVKAWTFDKPAAAPFVETLVYDYRVDPNLTCEDNGSAANSHAIFDFPTRVAVTACGATVVDTSSRKK